MTETEYQISNIVNLMSDCFQSNIIVTTMCFEMLNNCVLKVEFLLRKWIQIENKLIVLNKSVEIKNMLECKLLHKT